jgi:endonuclease III
VPEELSRAPLAGGGRSPLDAALILLVLCVGWQLWSARSTPRVAPCVPAAEAAAVDGWTTAIRCGGDPKRPPEWLRGPARLLFDQPLDLNRADALALESLPGIGPRRAEAIVRERCERAFGGLSELVRVPGIGPRTVAALEGRARAAVAVGHDGSGVACP